MSGCDCLEQIYRFVGNVTVTDCPEISDIPKVKIKIIVVYLKIFNLLFIKIKKLNFKIKFSHSMPSYKMHC
jgi:hypothetical protein